MSDTEEVKAKLDIVEVIREYIPVRAAGANFQAICPFHNEKTPSFSISPDKQIWHCFGCGRGGDVFSFVMEKEGLSFPETLRLLAAKAGVPLKNDNPESRSKRNRLLDIMELAGKYYAHILKSSAGAKAKDYLLRRGLKEETIADWHLGYSQDSWSALYDFLKQRPLLGRKFSDDEIMAAGLIIRKDHSTPGGRAYYDRFRDRVMFPIWDVNNNIVAFTARVNPDKEQTEKMGKYINSPQTDIYDKSRILFALNKAKNAIRKEDLAIVVEGQMDAISCHNHGFENVVASSGTALTSEQIALIKRFTNNLALSFDMDKAGQMAADRGIKEALAQNMNLKIITLKNGKDPDECLRNNPDDFRQAIAAAQPVLEYYFHKIAAGLDLSKLDNKISVRAKMFEMIGLVPNSSEQGYWLKRISEELDFSESDIREEFNRFKHASRQAENKRPGSPAAEEKTLLEPQAREERLSELLLALLVRFPEFIAYSLESLEPEQLVPETAALFYKTLIIYYNKTNSLEYEPFSSYLRDAEPAQAVWLDKLVLLGENNYYNQPPDEAKAEMIKIMMELKRCAAKKRLKQLEKSLAAAEAAADSSRIAAIMGEIKQATDELKKLN